ncbi:uncharacterized protein RSE6_00653 [Rhynchosporium secalis]|uniref:Uncharacterized protein n=1 Tax=Rhynchosporium secalis TaxID=38038 RepID=A0A1E1LVT2_RHYSE|nr:uncharacterized protein RSE6_00653 [Rhynchosporium secalis]
MINPTSYQELEERMKHLRTLQLDKTRIADEEAQEKRRKLQAHKSDKLSTAGSEATAQEKCLEEEQEVKNQALMLKQTDELNALRQRHVEEFEERLEELRLAMGNLASKHSAEREKLEHAFGEEKSDIDTELEKVKRQIQAADEAEIKQIKDDLVVYFFSRPRPEEPTRLDTGLAKEEADNPVYLTTTVKNPEHNNVVRTADRASTVAMQPVLQTTLVPSPQQQPHSETSSPHTLIGRGDESHRRADIQVAGEKRKSVDNTCQEFGRIIASSRAIAPSETGGLKRQKSASPSITLDPKKYFEVLRLRHTKHSVRGYQHNISNELWKHTNEKLYLDLGVEIYRPVSMRDYNKMPENAAHWFIDRTDVVKVQYDMQRSLGQIRLKAGLVWIKFKDKDILTTFLEVMMEKWPSFARPIGFPQNFTGFPPEFENE